MGGPWTKEPTAPPDLPRLIKDVLAELGYDADAAAVVELVRRPCVGLPIEDEFSVVCAWLGSANNRPLLAESGLFGLPLAPLDTCMRRFDLSRPNPAVRYNPLAIDTLSANRVVSQNA